MIEAVVADFKHALALWPGRQEEAEDRHASLSRRCKALGASDDARLYLRVLEVGRQVDEAEMAQMVRTKMIPRRVTARFQRGDFA